MAESNINFSEGSGKRIHTWDRTISSTLIQDQFVLPGEFPYASYSAVSASVSIATANDHTMQLMAGASLNVRIRRIYCEQASVVTTAAIGTFQLLRLTTAGTGGTAVTPAKLDNADAASGAAAMTLPSAKGTESTLIATRKMILTQTVPTAGGQIPAWTWEACDACKPLIIAAGTSNGIAIKNTAAFAAGNVAIHIEFVETAFL